MAEIIQNGAPTKDTVGQVGDIYTDALTLRQFECFAVYKTTTDKGTVIEYDWDEIYSSSSSGGSSDDAAKIAALTAKNVELSTKNSELSAANTELETANAELEATNSELESEITDINAALEEIIGGV